MNAYILCGPPASGKSTLSIQLATEYNAKLHHFDEYPNAFHPKKCKDALNRMWENISKELQNGDNVICDNIHTTKVMRANILDAISNIHCKKICIVLLTPLEECFKRNANRETRLPDFVLYDIYEKFELPTLDEGWDEIWYYK